jgi:nitrite reductase/ring-hydroxylating ferredoxin subunit
MSKTDLSQSIPLCNSSDLQDSGLAVGFDVLYSGETCRAFAVRVNGQVQAYLNRCSHIAMEMDYQQDRFFDESGQWLMCATHGATYDPETGDCVGGPCRGGLVKIALSEAHGVVHWHTAHHLQPINW